MQEEEWIETLADGRSVKFIYQVLPSDGDVYHGPDCRE
jgi:hypothetical protein